MEIGENLSVKAKADLLLVNKALNNNQKAFEQLMNKYRETVYFMVLKMVKNNDDAQDVTMEAFSKAFNNLHQYTPNYAFSTWLFKIASNHCIDFLRKQKKRIVSIDKGIDFEDGETVVFEIQSEDLNPEQTMVKEQRFDVLKEYVSLLKPRYRQLVEMRYFQELSYQEISEILNLPVGTVKAQLFRSREYLYNYLNQNAEAI